MITGKRAVGEIRSRAVLRATQGKREHQNVARSKAEAGEQANAAYLAAWLSWLKMAVVSRSSSARALVCAGVATPSSNSPPDG